MERNIESNIAKALEREELFQKKLRGDVLAGDVFMAVRKNRLDFYYKGGKVFTYDGEFRTHIKYASVYRLDEEKDYVSQKDLNRPKTCDFVEDYERIKENCALHSGIEGEGVARVYSRYSYAKSISGARVLDIEVSFKSIDEGRKQDRIDLLLLNNGILQFYEAKHFSNGEIWAKPGAKPKVVGQIARYHEQIKGHENHIVEQYRGYVKIVNKMFALNIELPQAVDRHVPLLVFGFDRDQLRGRFKTLFEGNLKGLIKYYPIGDISKMQINNLWSSCNS